jgi:hypothetical protein
MSAFTHQQSAHCESGVMSSLLTHHGLPMSEPMAFGLAAAASFALIPLVKISGLPLVAYRMPPRSIIRGCAKKYRRAHGIFNFRMQLNAAWMRWMLRWTKGKLWVCKPPCSGCRIFLKACVFISMRTILIGVRS